MERSGVIEKLDSSTSSNEPDQPKESEDNDILVGRSWVMNDLRRILTLVARNDYTVLLHGETGSGKEAAANFIYSKYHGKGRFIVIDCASLNDSMAEAELFGHAKGAFTGAISERTGLFHQAHDGVAFFDEIGEIPLHLQPKFLRLTEDKTVRPIGTNDFSKVRVKIVAGTNRDLKAEVVKGKFRRDLYARFNVIAIRMPTLREHPEDIPEIVNHFLGLNPETIALSKEALDFLKSYPWPENVRQLRSALERASTLCQNRVNGVITLEKSDFEFLEGSETITDFSEYVPDPVNNPNDIRRIRQNSFEKEELAVLKKLCSRGLNGKEISRVTKMSYKSIRNKLQKYGLKPDRSQRRSSFSKSTLTDKRVLADKKTLTERERLMVALESGNTMEEVLSKLGLKPQQLLSQVKRYNLNEMLKKLLQKEKSNEFDDR